MTARMKQRQDAAQQVLSWGGTWLESVIEHLNAGPNLRLNIVVETIGEAVKHEAFGAAAAAVASALGRLLECTRVSVGFRERVQVTVVAISNTARFEQRTNLVRSVAAAMDEAIDQDRRLSLPDDDSRSLAADAFTSTPAGGVRLTRSPHAAVLERGHFGRCGHARAQSRAGSEHAKTSRSPKRWLVSSARFCIPSATRSFPCSSAPHSRSEPNCVVLSNPAT